MAKQFEILIVKLVARIDRYLNGIDLFPKLRWHSG
jgi:hypothetical protein